MEPPPGPIRLRAKYFSILSWPLGIYTGYFREHAYGLATQTFGEWSLDELKELLLSLVFIPPIFGLFLALSILEDSGYMARAAFVMDRFMYHLGLHGRSFIPLMIGFGCNVPAIMAARSMDNEKDRMITMLISPLISCSARLPVYVLIAGALYGAAYAGTAVFAV